VVDSLAPPPGELLPILLIDQDSRYASFVDAALAQSPGPPLKLLYAPTLTSAERILDHTRVSVVLVDLQSPSGLALDPDPRGGHHPGGIGRQRPRLVGRRRGTGFSGQVPGRRHPGRTDAPVCGGTRAGARAVPAQPRVLSVPHRARARPDYRRRRGWADPVSEPGKPAHPRNAPGTVHRPGAVRPARW
jgi:hypothetical protein